MTFFIIVYLLLPYFLDHMKKEQLAFNFVTLYLMVWKIWKSD